MIKSSSEAYFKDGIWGWTGSLWRKLAMLWGYSDRLVENLGGTQSPAGNYVASSTAVPAGEVHTLQTVSILNTSGARGAVYVRVVLAGVSVYLAYSAGLATWVPLIFATPITLKQGDYVVLQMNSCLDLDVLYAGICGYKMKIAE